MSVGLINSDAQEDSGDNSGMEFGGDNDPAPQDDESKDVIEEEDVPSESAIGSVPLPFPVPIFTGATISSVEEEITESHSAREVGVAMRILERHYQDYRRLKNEVETVFAQFRHSMHPGDMEDIVRGHPEIQGRTIRDWYANWLEDPDWRPY